LDRVGWKANYFNAIRPTSLDGFPSLGAKGCFLSHLEVLKQSISEKQHLIIMEDDLNFVPDFLVHWPNALSELLAQNWSIFYPAVDTQGAGGLSLLQPYEGVQTAHFMVINQASIPTIVGGLEAIIARPSGHPEGGAMHVDGAYSTIRAK